MTLSILVPLILVAGIAPEQMRAIVADRLGRLDKLVIEMTWQNFVNPVSHSPLDRDSWVPYVWDLKHPHRVKIVRPDLLDEGLTDDPEKGYVPVISSVFDGTFVRKHVRPDRDGRTVYSINRQGVGVAEFWEHPTLQIFDIDIHGGCIPQLNLVRLFDEFAPALVGGVGDMSTYVATIPCDGWTLHLELDLNSRGTPVHGRTSYEFITAEAEPGTVEFFTLATTEVNGAELPLETVVASFNPNVNRQKRCVFHNVVTSVSVDPTLTASDIRIVPELRNANVTRVGADGLNTQRIYDADGSIVRTTTFAGVQSVVDGSFVSGQSLRWRWLIPATAAATAVATLLVLRFVVRPAAP
jgi:hypothetical protein